MRSEWARRLVLALGALGFVLGPFSYWNDLYVNVPLSLAIAKALNVLTGMDLTLGFVVGYVSTNIVGVLLQLLAARSLSEQSSGLAGLAGSFLKVTLAGLLVGVLLRVLAAGLAGVWR